MFFADLHLHSKYSRAVSPQMDLEHINRGAAAKGLGLVGTADFTHPRWNSELRSKLEETDAGSGIYRLKSEPDSAVRFVLQTEVSTIFSDAGKVKKVHHVLFSPSLEAVDSLNDLLSKRGNLAADGRPTFGSTTPAQLVEICESADARIEDVPAHAWTPWFSVFGSNSGYDSIEEAFDDKAGRIRAFETGLSSDPAMNWRISALDKYSQLSNSDSHSYHSFRLGRECNAFELPLETLTFDGLLRAIYTRKGFSFTVEVDPAYGKYHFDGHRNCKFSCTPEQSIKMGNKCPKCGKTLTIGVLHRVEQLADRPEGFKPKGAVPYKTLLPLQELVAAVRKTGLASKRAAEETNRLAAASGSELSALIYAPLEKIRDLSDAALAKAVADNRAGKLWVRPGFDGEYGVLELEKPGGEAASGAAKKAGQKGLADFIE